MVSGLLIIETGMLRLYRRQAKLYSVVKEVTEYAESEMRYRAASGKYMIVIATLK